MPVGPRCLTGPGDDCAVVEHPAGRWGLLKTDCVIEGVHFLPEADPERVGWKAAARVVSDFAAMGGGQPEHALVTLLAPKDRAVTWAEGVYRGIRRCAERFGFGLAGGETSLSPVTVISIAMTGSIKPERCVRRSAAQVGDAICVTGRLGGSIAGKHFDFVPRVEEARWLAANAEIHAMMDLSDGLAKDLPRLARASGVGFQVDAAALPLNEGCGAEQALRDGEDYELLFTLPSVPENWPFEIPLTRIGSIVPRAESESLEGGWDPFTRP